MIELLPPGPAAITSPPIASPCIGVCVMEADGLCRGCARTIAEIAGWGTAAPATRAAIMAALPARQAGRAPS